MLIKTKTTPNPSQFYHKFSNYSCPNCSLLPEIISCNEALNTITLKCEKHGEKVIDIHEYLDKMSRFESKANVTKRCKCPDHSDQYVSFFCQTCNQNFCTKCEKEKRVKHTEHKIYKISFLHPNNNEILYIKNKINIYLQEKNELLKKLEIIEDKIIFFDLIINAMETQKENYLLNTNVLKLVYGENLNLDEKVQNNKETINLSGSAYQEYRKEKFDEFIINNYSLATKNKGELNLTNKKSGDEIITDVINGIDNSSIFRLVRLKKITPAGDDNILSFKTLKVLNLRGNNITNIDFLYNKSFPIMEVLSLNDNEISSIDNLTKVNLPNLRELYLSKNKIEKIDCLGELKIKRLQILWLSNNNIIDIKVLEKVYFPGLQKLGLNKNSIKEINVLSKIKFPQLNELYINDNEVDINSDENVQLIEKISNKIKEFYY